MADQEEQEGDQESDAFFMNLKGEEEQMYLLDKLFIETGEDVEDMFIAFKLHKLMWLKIDLGHFKKLNLFLIL